MKKLIALLILVCLFASAEVFPAYAETAAKAPAVKCYNGTFVGSEENGVLSFKGIPFAKPPIGELRWKAPQSVEASDETFDATSYGKAPLLAEEAAAEIPLTRQATAKRPCSRKRLPSPSVSIRRI